MAPPKARQGTRTPRAKTSRRRVMFPSFFQTLDATPGRAQTALRANTDGSVPAHARSVLSKPTPDGRPTTAGILTAAKPAETKRRKDRQNAEHLPFSAFKNLIAEQNYCHAGHV